jgi:hypothetical protein
MPRETKTALTLPLTEDEAKMLAYVWRRAMMNGPTRNRVPFLAHII